MQFPAGSGPTRGALVRQMSALIGSCRFLFHWDVDWTERQQSVGEFGSCGVRQLNR